jgi:hypothetical protein
MKFTPKWCVFTIATRHRLYPHFFYLLHEVQEDFPRTSAFRT